MCQLVDEMATDGDGTGNTGKQSRPEAVEWFLTFNNYTMEEAEEVATMAMDYCSKFRMQEEICPKTGTPHLQGNFRFETKKRLSELKKWNRKIHWEITRKSDKAMDYCTKHRTAAGAKWSKGYPKPVKILQGDQLFSWQVEIEKLFQSEPDDRKIYWYWGDTGIGKTTFCKYLTIKYGAIPLSGKSADMKNGIVEYVKKNGDTPTAIIIPIPKTFNLEYISYEGIEQVKDMYFYSGKYEGGVVCGNCPHIVIFANEPPRDMDMLAKDRWVITNLGPTR